ncbi:isochorismatase family protein [Sphingopyxis sp.]|uniref:isochorismatase family protein n=1 Tax=Sphingopyxis sp. TaxID=1908224 RepID=UPI00261ABCB2|nr:isochorismatase family protein [Sphingopyxis sp.]MCW0199853.1 isochorismatase family protein [Sphingopyxis sp.]
MASAKIIRDPQNDHMLTPQNAALVIIDYQPVQVGSIVTMNKRLLIDNIVAVARLAKLYALPVVLSTVNVETGLNSPTIHQITDVLDEVSPIDRTAINAWEDTDFVAAVKVTGRTKLIMAALWTEVCLVFPAIDALREGFEIFAVIDAVGGTSEEAHRAGIQRIVQAGGVPISWVQLACELQRDWNRTETAQEFAAIALAEVGH